MLNGENPDDLNKNVNPKAVLLTSVIIMLILCVIGFIINYRDNGKHGGGEMTGYTQITMKEAKTIFEVPGDYIIVDVRRADEYAGGHIPGAINVPNETIADTQSEALPDKNQTIYVYCRSGNRSRLAADKLAAMGYTNVIEFGGILDWAGELEKNE